MPAGSRDRVTVDLRGAGSLVRARATAQGLTVAAFVRRAVLKIADVRPDAAEPHSLEATDPDQSLIKVTLRLTADHAMLLAMRARSAEVSQGRYITGLLEGQPPPHAAPDRREAIAALAKSTDQLAVMSTDLQTVLRLIRTASPERAEPFRGKVKTLVEDVRAHLDMACLYLADLPHTAARRHPHRSRRRSD